MVLLHHRCMLKLDQTSTLARISLERPPECKTYPNTSRMLSVALHILDEFKNVQLEVVGNDIEIQSLLLVKEH